jgi:cyclic pyranopterin phosphate synthase
VSESRLTHLDADGNARMVDVGAKSPSERRARARVRVRMSPRTAAAIVAGEVAKGEVLGTARLAGIMAAKQTAALIPLAHPVALSFVDVAASVDVEALDHVIDEMEALVACSVAALTVYDMVKGLEQGIVIEQLVLLKKTGGRRDHSAEPSG